MSSGWPRRQQGRTWLEFAVAMIVIGLIGGFWISSVQDLQAESEKTTVDLTVRTMRTGLQLRITELMLENRAKEIPTLAGQNPVQWLVQPPERYLGEFTGPPRDPPPRSWYFDRSTHALVYVPGAARFSRVAGVEGPLAWRIEPGSGFRDGGMAGIRLAQLP